MLFAVGIGTVRLEAPVHDKEVVLDLKPLLHNELMFF
jgi:hypothetical protein